MDVKAFWYVLLLHNDLRCRLNAALEPPLISKAEGMGKTCKVDLRLERTVGAVQCSAVALCQGSDAVLFLGFLSCMQ